MDAILRVENVIKRFGGLIALNEVNLKVPEGKIIGIIGPNGSGKTTLLNCINGLLKIDGGKIFFKDRRIDNLPAHVVARMGVSRTFQVPQVFPKLTVLENVILPMLYLKYPLEELRKKALEILDYVGLAEFSDRMGHELSGGQQKLLEMARALISDPELFLLDEPFAGVHTVIKRKLFDVILDLNKRLNKTFIVVSHDLASIYKLSEKVIFLSEGRNIAEGKPEEIQSNREVIEAYLGG